MKHKILKMAEMGCYNTKISVKCIDSLFQMWSNPKADTVQLNFFYTVLSTWFGIFVYMYVVSAAGATLDPAHSWSDVSLPVMRPLLLTEVS